MLSHQSTRLGAQFKHRQARRVVDIEWSAVEFTHTRIELLPLLLRELTTFDFLAFKFTDIGNQTVYQLKVRHFKRENCCRCIVVDSHVLSHRQHECRLTHSRTSRNNNEVGVLPTGGEFIKLMEACFQSAQAIVALSGKLYLVESYTNHRVYLCEIFLQVALRDRKQLTLSLLQ